MKFNPLTEKYIFEKDALTKTYPDYLKITLYDWVQRVLFDSSMCKYRHDLYGGTDLNTDFLNELNVTFREHFPRTLESFLQFIFEDDDRITNILALFLENYANMDHAGELSILLEKSGSSYTVILTAKNPTAYQKGVANLVERVPESVQKAANHAISTNDLLKDAWIDCYGKDPHYVDCIRKCIDALEGLLKNSYAPHDPKPSLGRLIGNIKQNPSNFSFQGSTLLDTPTAILDLANRFLQVRGHHTSGDGREPTKEEAVFILHYTIFFFSIH